MSLRVLLIEPYYGGSHRVWADTIVRYSRHQIDLLTLPAENWKWRMRGGAITLARLFTERDEFPDVMLVSDMMDVALFRSLLPAQANNIPLILYFHENQLTYPQNQRQNHGWQYGFINYASALCADTIVFNSRYHLEDFFAESWRMLRHARDYNELDTLDHLRERADVLSPALDLKRFDRYQPEVTTRNDPPIILWNHRWEADKNPQAFFAALDELVRVGLDFRVILAGENVRQKPQEFEAARDRLGDRVIHYGFAGSFAAYARLLWQADYVVSTADHDFFGIAVVEAIYCQCIPLLAKRLNYPYLIPSEMQSSCLFRRGTLPAFLKHHLKGDFNVYTPRLRQHIARFDRTIVVPEYDAMLEHIAD